MSDPGHPLAGLRVLDFTWAAMGPYAGYLLAGLGAEVIHVGRPDAERSGRATAALYQELNVGKICVGIDVKRGEGPALMRRLVATADVFLENFRPGVVERLGLGWAEASREHPGLVMVSSSALGRERADAGYVGYAPIFCALSGVAYVTGHPDGPPVEIRHPADLTGGAVTALAALAGLGRRRRTGAGCYIDLAAREALLWTLTHALVASQVDPRRDERLGNGHPRSAPHGLYRCQGEDRWVSVAVASDEEWRRLCEAMDRRDLAGDPRFVTETDRQAHREEIDRVVQAWTEARSAEAATRALQAAGVAAFPSVTNRDLWEDPHLHARQVFEPVGDGAAERWAVTPPWIFGPGPRRLPRTIAGAEAIQHTFGNVLGLEAATISRLEAEGIIG